MVLARQVVIMTVNPVRCTHVTVSPSGLWIRFKSQELSAGRTAEKSVVVTVRFHRSLIGRVTTVDAEFSLE